MQCIDLLVIMLSMVQLGLSKSHVHQATIRNRTRDLCWFPSSSRQNDPVEVWKICCEVLEGTCQNSCCPLNDYLCECCAKTEVMFDQVHPAEFEDIQQRCSRYGNESPEASEYEERTCVIDPVLENRTSPYPLGLQPFVHHDKVTGEMMIDLPQFCCFNLAQSGMCPRPFVNCFIETESICTCGRQTDEVASMFKYIPINSKTRTDAVTVSPERIEAVDSRLKNDSTDVCYSKPSIGKRDEWEWVDMSALCCKIRGVKFKKGCCYKQQFDYCYECESEENIGRGEGCLVQISTEMNFINNKLKSKIQVYSFAAFCCHIMQCNTCISHDKWPFCQCVPKRPQQDASLTSLKKFRQYNDSRYVACCA
ncbi:unnamed protein product, partial [Owenia fusiformis]